MKVLAKRRKIKIAGREVGVTMIEILLAMALIALLSLGAMAMYSNNSKKARDAKRLADMTELTTALENYYDDNGCFPDDAVVNDCNGTGLQPYLESVSCDPSNNSTFHYLYEREDCSTFRVYVRLEDESNERIEMVGCEQGCGPNDAYNYFASSGNVAVSGGIGSEPPTCGGAEKYCFPGVCSTCCPGVNYRCAPDGKSCLVDTMCSQ